MIRVELVCGPGLLADTSVVFTFIEVSCEVTEGEGLSSASEEEADTGELMAEVVSSTEGGLGLDVLLGLLLRGAVASEWGRL